MQRTFEPTKAMMEWMTDKLKAKFPWPKYFQYVMKVYGPLRRLMLVHGAFGKRMGEL